MDSKSVVTEIRKKRKDAINPLIVEFQNGDVVDDKLSTLQVVLSPNALKDKNVEVASSGSHKFKDNSVSFNLTPSASRYIAIRNRKTNKIKLVEVDYASLINSLHLRKEEVVQVAPENDIKMQMNNLKRLFGTKKRGKTLDAMENIEAFQIEEQIQQISVSEVNNSRLQESFSEEGEENFNFFIPPCNREAENINDVYRLQDWLTDLELTCLHQKAEEILNRTSKSEEKYSTFFEAFFNEITTFKENLRDRLACLLYADCLVTCMKTPSKGLSKMADTVCPYSKLLSTKIVQQFCIKSGNSLHRPLKMRDKTVCHVIVLLLMACNYRLDLELLTKQISIGVNKIKQFARLAGAVPAGKDSKMIVLKLPLPTQQSLVKKPQRRRRQQ